MYMKIEKDDNKIIIYLFDEFVNVDNISSLSKKIKDIFVKIMKRYNYDFFGYNKVNVYYNEYFGLILEVEQIKNNEYSYSVIDLKITVYNNANLFIEFDNIYNFKLSRVKVYNGKYYLEINNKDDINQYIEYGKVRYKKNF